MPRAGSSILIRERTSRSLLCATARLLLAALVGSLAACASSNPDVALGWRTPGPRVDPGKDPEGAALEFASSLWPTAFTDGQDSYFSMEQASPSDPPRLTEYEGVTFSVEPLGLTGADRSANVEWKGHARMSAARRRWRSAGHWSEWEDAAEVATVTLRLIRGGWIASPCRLSTQL